MKKDMIFQRITLMTANAVNRNTTIQVSFTKRKIMTKYYDPSGAYKAYSTDGKNLFNESAEHIGYFFNGFLYDVKGAAIGHVKGKWILDKSGQPIYYTD